MGPIVYFLVGIQDIRLVHGPTISKVLSHRWNKPLSCTQLMHSPKRFVYISLRFTSKHLSSVAQSKNESSNFYF